MGRGSRNHQFDQISSTNILFGPSKSAARSEEAEEKRKAIRAREELREPTKEDSQGNKFWLDEAGLPHRDGDLPAVLYDGNQEWHRHGKLHREGGPAKITKDGLEVWFKEGGVHRDPDDGPAILRPDGTREWWVDNQRIKLEDPNL